MNIDVQYIKQNKTLRPIKLTEKKIKNQCEPNHLTCIERETVGCQAIWCDSNFY